MNMCEHKKDDGKKQVVISGLCRQCSANERFDQREILKLINKQQNDYRKMFLRLK